MADSAFLGNRINASMTATPNFILALAKAAFETLREWRRRSRSRKELALYSYHERNDVGCAMEIEVEIAKPFWRK
jgi:uncharacterized protein YjiS (DUF1127 family)